MKQRFSSLDVKVIANELSKTLVPLRVTNVYDLSSRIFLIKFHKPDHREQLIIESGFRCHLTNYARTTAAAPSGFVARLRKYLKTRRVTSISQVGTDRIIEFQFSDGLYRLYLEFYAGGNIVLTDGNLKVLALLRNVDEGAEHERLRVGLEYNLSLRQNYGGAPELTKERVREGLQKAVERQQNAAAGKKSKKQGKDALRKALAVSITECSPLLVDHALHIAKFDSTLKPEQVLQDEDLLDKLVTILLDARTISESITKSDPVKGYILAKPNPAAPKPDSEGADKPNLLYDDLHPFRPAQFEDSEYTFIEFEGFSKAVDEFFSSIEGQKLESKLHERELAAQKKLDSARKEHENRIGGLQQVQELNFRKAEAILANVHRVTEAMEAVNGLIGQGMDWGEIDLLIEREQAQGNAVAQMIKLPLKLHENTVTILLDENSADQVGQEDEEGYETSSVSEDSDEDEPATSSKKANTPPKVAAPPKLAIDIDLSLSAWANSTEYFDQRRSAAGKEARTLQASEKALKSHERKVQDDLKKGLKQEKEVLRPVRRQQWFEKFIYFLSSDGYLVLGGKDAQQNEIIYRRYFRKGDVYVHADLKGAQPMIIKNKPNTPDAPIPPSTLSQAGHLSVCTSEAWDSKAVMSAWWVNSEQVSKTDQTGTFLPPGMFNVTGKKEFLPPAQLIVGLGVIFEISEESKARHQKHRIGDAPTTEYTETKADNGTAAAADGQDSDSEEDFPDAKIEEESDDDFPDAKLDEGSDASDDDEPSGRSNPLQSSAPGNRNDSDADSDAGEEAKPQGVAGKTTTTHTEQDDVGSVADSEKTESKQGKRHLSARERRLLRKGQTPDSLLKSESQQQSDEEEDDASKANFTEVGTQTSRQSQPAASVFSQTSKASTNKPLPRGKRGKAKKVAAKYADQDEEERALAMRLLGATSGQKAKEDEAEAKRAKEEEALANKQRRREQHLRAQAIGKAAEEARRAAHEGNGQDDDAIDDETLKAQLLELDALTGRPLPGDEIISAIPVCAPWSALASFKYKVKIQPGAVKRGKAVKEILMRWDAAGKNPRATDKHSKDVERIWPQEISLIRGWKETEVVGVMPVSKVRVMMAGGTSGGGGGGGNSGGAKGKAKSARGGRGSKKR
ncbi:serologically defined colon cancer antigen 1 [Aaosphaeria arxii CBS 175.79]|uniref:Ribosome quality control complex subunit 2 n=1 Tax=Aaosphaeria arxii CBS 175.79 TaxID=1450172 RepID=A0A6A5XHK6_9PLEO|nr:serologically defined colon cancer antigen 1 [Aaosphaeria arxii CBS 175.79]KAF2012260.1 serologically defined colon cancer antigen 1 [Aaosphaeria arxii CBS 175.79]